MELARDDALFMVKARVTEDKLLRLERGTRVLGFQNGAKKILSIFCVIALVCLVAKGFFDGMASMILAAIGGAMLLIFMAGSYALAKGWAGTKRDIKKKYNENKAEYQKEKEYYFFEDHYEIAGEFEHSRLEYKNIGRMLDMSGMLVFLEKGDVVRFFMKEEVKKGNATELAGFLERMSETKMEYVSVK
ncbi:MAG: hypothetical protein IIW68_06955 [Lachnospiraceae bacterium]|nr:hypothetical protein [Lachnospiraceae bacterium]